MRTLDVYLATIDVVALADEAWRPPGGRASLADQLQRAATSIALTTAEGAPLALSSDERGSGTGTGTGTGTK